MGWHLDGRVSAMFGTHTHIQTADERVLPGGTAYITDVGMTGPYDSVLGRDKRAVIRNLMTSMPFPFNVAIDDVRLCGAMVEIDAESGKATSIERICERETTAVPAGDEDGEGRRDAGDVAALGGQREGAAGHRDGALRPALPGGEERDGRAEGTAEQRQGETAPTGAEGSGFGRGVRYCGHVLHYRLRPGGRVTRGSRREKRPVVRVGWPCAPPSGPRPPCCGIRCPRRRGRSRRRCRRRPGRRPCRP